MTKQRNSLWPSGQDSALTAEGLGSIRGWETKITKAPQGGQNKEIELQIFHINV